MRRIRNSLAVATEMTRQPGGIIFVMSANPFNIMCLSSFVTETSGTCHSFCFRILFFLSLPRLGCFWTCRQHCTDARQQGARACHVAPCAPQARSSVLGRFKAPPLPAVSGAYPNKYLSERKALAKGKEATIFSTWRTFRKGFHWAWRTFAVSLLWPGVRRFSDSLQVMAPAFLSPVGTFANSHAAQARGTRDVRKRAPAGRLTAAIALPGLRINERTVHGLAPVANRRSPFRAQQPARIRPRTL